MENKNQEQLEERKEERIDELDIIGGSIFMLLRNAFSKLVSLISPRKVE